MNKYIDKHFLILFVLISLSGFINGQSIWEITNPIPPFEDSFIDVQFFDNQIGWVLTEQGRLIYTTNSAFDWQIINNEVCLNPKDLFFLNTNIGWLAGSGVYKTSNGGLSWEKKFDDDEGNFTSVFFITENIGFVGNIQGNIYKTTNGGNNWSLSANIGLATAINKLYFINENSGWALCDDYFYGTSNGGETWQILLSYAIISVNDFHFIDENTGWVAGYNADLYYTETAGSEWEKISIAPTQSEDLISVYFFDQNNGRVFSEYKCYITYNGGLSWDEGITPFLDYISVSYPTEEFMCAVGDEIIYSNTAGYTWNTVERGHDVYQTGICKNSENTIFISGDNGKILKKENSESSWETIQTPTDKILTDVCLLGDSMLWSCGYDGTLMFSEIGSLNWNMIDLGMNKDLHAISFSFDQTGCCIGENGKVYLTQNAGETCQEIICFNNDDLSDVFFINNELGWISSNNGSIYKSTDGGINWQEESIIQTGGLYCLYFVNENTGWCGGHGKIYHTSDGGETWELQEDNFQNPQNNDRIYAINFINENHGWAIGQDGVLCHTTDGGENWVIHKRLVDTDLFGLAFLNQHEVLVVGEEGNILYTDHATYLAPKIISIASDTILCEGSYLSVKCISIGDSLNYQWKYGNELIPGATENILTFDSISVFQGGLYSCMVSNGAGTITSEKFMVSIKPNITITGHPQDETLHENDTVIFNLAVSGALPIRYQWQKNGEDIEGAIYNVYPIYGVKQSDTGYYKCVVLNDCNSLVTDSAKLFVQPLGYDDFWYSANRVSIYPNPAKSWLQIKFSNSTNNIIGQIYNSKGVKINSFQILNQEQVKINIEGYLHGIYFLQLSDGTNRYSSKFIKK